MKGTSTVSVGTPYFRGFLALALPLAFWSPVAQATDDPPPEAAPVVEEPAPQAVAAICDPVTIFMTSPTNGATAVGPASFTVSADAEAMGCSISQVVFKANGTNIAVDTTAPYSYAWTNVMPGSYAITAQGFDQNGASRTTLQARNVTVTSPISISLTAPSNGTVALAPATFTLNATATDSKGTITKVEFYSNGALIGSDTSSPFSLSYANVAAGTYALTAKATDSLGIVTTSSAINVTSNAIPTVSLTSPVNGATSIAPASFTLTASASDSDSDGTVSKVEFYSNGVLVNTASTSPYTYTYAGVGSGNYALTAKVTDNLNGTRTSVPVNVSVNALPSVSLTAPVNGASIVGPTDVTLTANASDTDGTISKVEFYSNGALINTDTSPPYSYVYPNVAVGNYALTAKAYDHLNASKTSTTTNITMIANGAPTVTLTAPSNGASLMAPANVTLSATASDADGSVAKVEFFSNGALISSVTTSPYAAALSNLVPGTYVLTAKATDNLGKVTTSTAATVTITSAGTVSVTRTYVYDSSQRLCKTINPESGATLADYDEAGNIIWSVDGSALTSATCDRASVPAATKTTHTYDARNRMLNVATPGAVADISTTYYPDSQVASIRANNTLSAPVLTEYTYNRRRLLTSESVSQGSPSVLYTLGYAYNGNGHLSTLTYPDLQSVSYAPNALGQATQVGSYATGISYYPNGAIQQFTYGNGAVHTMTQNTRQLPTRSRDVKGTTVILDDTYNFDENGNVTDITDQAQGGLTTRGMGYDDRDRLIAAVAPGLWGNASYAYDGFDNLTRADEGARQYRYTYTSNQHLSQINNANGITQFTFGYDAKGNVSSKSSQIQVFDVANRLTQVAGLESYRYDGMGRRVQTTDADGKTTFWQYSQAGQVLYASEARRTRNTHYIYLGNTQIAQRHMAWGSGTVTVEYMHTDALGSPVAQTNALGAIANRGSFTPWGEAGGLDGPGYTGHIMDGATGLTYMQQRYYDPSIGRFLSVDPVAAGVSDFNRYAYVADNPFKFTDPDGRRKRAGAPLSKHLRDLGVRLMFAGYMMRSAKDSAAALQASPKMVEKRLKNFVNPDQIADVVDSTEGRDFYQSGKNLEPSDRRFAYTRKDGFIDLAHASSAYRVSVTPGAGQLLGDLGNEFFGDFLWKGNSSAFMPEDHAGHLMSTKARWLNLFHFGRLSPGQALQLSMMERGALTKEEVISELAK